MTDPPYQLALPDLRPLLDVVARELRPDQFDTIKSLSGLGNAFLPRGSVHPRELWVPLFEAALKESPEALALLLDNIRKDTGAQTRSALARALQEVGITCVSRITRTAHPEFGNHADALITAKTVPEMRTAANDLRETALSARRLLMHPLLLAPFLQLDPSVMDPEKRRMELADLAVDVITAVDFLLVLLGDASAESPRLVLATESGSERGVSPSDDEASYRLTARQFDARSTAVRVGQRLLARLSSDVATG
jgi:hypothetical protein